MSIRKALALALGVAVLVGLNYYLRHTLEHGDTFVYNFLNLFYANATRELFSPAFPKWKLLLPLPQLSGAWTTTTLILTHMIEVRIGAPQTWYLLNALIIVVSFATSWAVFRSSVFSYTFAICMGFGTQLYHTYAVAGTVSFYLLFAYYQVLLLCAYKVVMGAGRRAIWWACLVLALLVTVVSYEGWLDLLTFVWVAFVFLAAMLLRLGDRDKLKRLAGVVGLMTVVGLAYIYIKTHYGNGQTLGAESDVVFNYPVRLPAIEDVISNIFTHFYIVFTNFLPPALVSSNSLYHVGPDRLVELQHGYSGPFSYLVVMHHVFLWRYYAGAGMVVFLLLAVKAIRRAWLAPAGNRITMALFIIMAGIGGPTHDFIKFRPMNSMPVLGYHVMVGVLGVSLLISYLLMAGAARLGNRWTAALLVMATWGMLFYGAVARPIFLSTEAAQVGLGPGLYPNPAASIMSLLNRPYEQPAGAKFYRLTEFVAEAPPAVQAAAPSPTAPAATPAQRTPAPQIVEVVKVVEKIVEVEKPVVPKWPDDLQPLPVAAPALTKWEPGDGVKVTSLGSGSSVALAGNATEAGYQLMSPPLALGTKRSVTVQVRGRVQQGRLCLGVLTADQQRWLVAPDQVGRAQASFDTGNASAVRFVLANCNVRGAALAPTQAQIASMTYGVFERP